MLTNVRILPLNHIAGLIKNRTIVTKFITLYLQFTVDVVQIGFDELFVLILGWLVFHSVCVTASLVNKNLYITATKNYRKAAVVGKRTTAVYAEGGRNPLFKCVSHPYDCVCLQRFGQTYNSA